MEARKDFHELHFDSIQALRGIAAIFVIMEHIPFLARGAFGVDIFFCISGFMIMFATHNNTKYFFRKRFVRIVPFYYLMTICTYFLLTLFPGMFETTSARLPYLIKSLLFIPFDIGGMVQPIVRIGWTINCEVFFYLLFGIAFHISHKYRGLICSIMLLVLVGIGAVLPETGVALGFYSNPVMLEFILGILCYYLSWFLYETGRRKQISKLWGYGCIPLAAYLFVRLYDTRFSFDITGLGRFLHWGLAAFVLVILFFLSGMLVQIPKGLVMLGNISFSIYLLHYYPLRFVNRQICDLSVIEGKTVGYALVTVLVVIAVSYLAWYWIEQRFTKWLLGKMIKGTAAK